ncbi:MAG TPA: hypothetical protein VIG97_14655 [Luteimonas sp.]
MWTPHLEKYTRPDGVEQKIGWVLVDEHGNRYVRESGAAVTGFTREEMQALADELNAAGGT